jgi:hypothetical protein
MNGATPLHGPIKRRRPILLYAGLAALLLAVLSLLVAGSFVLPRLRGRGFEFPNPVQVVRDWLWPPPVLIVDFDWDGMIEVVPDPLAQDSPENPPDPGENPEP